MPKALKTVKNAKIVKAAKPAKSARRVVKPQGRRAHAEGSLEGPHARHQGIEGDEANSWRSPAPSWYPRPRTRPPPVRFSVFRVISAPLPYRRTCPWRPSGLAQDAIGLCCADRERPRCLRWAGNAARTSREVQRDWPACRIRFVADDKRYSCAIEIPKSLGGERRQIIANRETSAYTAKAARGNRQSHLLGRNV